MNSVLADVLARASVQPVLIDIGASAGPPVVWEPIAAKSIYIGFDPDLREIQQTTGGRYNQSTIINKAVTHDASAHEVTFYLTRFPYCSSTLIPDHDALSHYVHSHLFEVERQVSVPATTLNAVVDQMHLEQVDWTKIDSQGTDLRLFNSLREELRTRVLALDIEPGLIDAYRGEDLWVDAHKALVAQGFWLSRLDVRGVPRVEGSTIEALRTMPKGPSRKLILRGVRKSPGWCECRYFRTVQWLRDHKLGKREHILLWAFAMLDRQDAFALDVAFEYERSLGVDDILRQMISAPLRRIRAQRLLSGFREFAGRVVRKIRAWSNTR